MIPQSWPGPGVYSIAVRGWSVTRTDILIQGHATGQTTGIGGHMASRFIPTVERESIDLV